jgi:acyl-coenzyme A thioesterase PaaI-like protein
MTHVASPARSAAPPQAANPVRALWDRLQRWPASSRLFSFAISRMVPYSGTIGARVITLRSGYAKVEMRDRRRVRNHLRSIHAIALANLGELCTGLAMTYAMPSAARGILTGLSVEYVKKARGLLTAECTCGLPDWRVRGEHEVVAEIRDREGDVVARVRGRWLIGPSARAAGEVAGRDGTTD